MTYLASIVETVLGGDGFGGFFTMRNVYSEFVRIDGFGPGTACIPERVHAHYKYTEKFH